MLSCWLFLVNCLKSEQNKGKKIFHKRQHCKYMGKLCDHAGGCHSFSHVRMTEFMCCHAHNILYMHKASSPECHPHCTHTASISGWSWNVAGEPGETKNFFISRDTVLRAAGLQEEEEQRRIPVPLT